MKSGNIISLQAFEKNTRKCVKGRWTWGKFQRWQHLQCTSMYLHVHLDWAYYVTCPCMRNSKCKSEPAATEYKVQYIITVIRRTWADLWCVQVTQEGEPEVRMHHLLPASSGRRLMLASGNSRMSNNSTQSLELYPGMSWYRQGIILIICFSMR